jgi:NADH-quinone oxidoreductase subunit L
MMPYIGFGVAMMTAFYMFRLVFLMFFGEAKRPDLSGHIHESPMTMKMPLMVLSVLSFWFVFSFNPFGAASGWAVKSLPTPVTVTGTHWYPFAHGASHETAAPAGEAAMPAGQHATESHAPAVPAESETPAHGGESVTQANPAQEAFAHGVHGAHLSAMITSLIVASLGILLAWLVYRRKIIDVDAFVARIKPLHTFLSRKWYFDEIYEQWVVVPFVLLTAKAMALFDAYVVDGAVNGIAKLTVLEARVSGAFDKYVVDGLVNFAGYGVGFVGIVLRKSQTGRIQTYLMFVILGVVVFFYVFY